MQIKIRENNIMFKYFRSKQNIVQQSGYLRVISLTASTSFTFLNNVCGLAIKAVVCQLEGWQLCSVLLWKIV